MMWTNLLLFPRATWIKPIPDVAAPICGGLRQNSGYDVTLKNGSNLASPNP